MEFLPRKLRAPGVWRLALWWFGPGEGIADDPASRGRADVSESSTDTTDKVNNTPPSPPSAHYRYVTYVDIANF
jgi:hypothetical protein